jgi:uncharacterized membrane-anchored protein YjiN (DUF445 family)
MEMQMNPDNDFDFVIVTGEEHSTLGIVRCQSDATFAEIRQEIVLDNIIGYPFEFTNNQGYTLNATQEKRWKATKTPIGIKRKLDTLDTEALQSNVMERTPNVEIIEENMEEPMHKQARVEVECDSIEQNIGVDSTILASWEQKVNSLMEEFVEEKVTLKVYSENGTSKIKIRCESCGIDYGTGEISLAARTLRNFKNNHMKTRAHQRNISRVGSSETPSCNIERKTSMVGDRIEIDKAIKILDDFNKTQDPNLFKVVEATLAGYEDKRKVKVECTRCNKWFYLVPASGNIVSSLNEHMKSNKHISTTNEASHNTIGLRTGIVGRPKKPTNDKSQQSLTRFLVPSSTPLSHRGSTSANPSTSGMLISQAYLI